MIESCKKMFLFVLTYCFVWVVIVTATPNGAIETILDPTIAAMTALSIALIVIYL